MKNFLLTEFSIFYLKISLKIGILFIQSYEKALLLKHNAEQFGWSRAVQ